MPNAALIIGTLYALMSGIAFVAYALDKRAARRGAWRTPESTLHLIELLGGWPGALAAQRMLRHKNRKRRYQLVFWCIVALHAAAWGFVAWLIFR
ncbi:MAG: hypothetical protein DHS20C14_12080 [Phycisphaeraceae bacterium]|nr:MAG: hypothetical protein DHS20C14_12080 [Phycisphaeraceae bacterium]